MDSDHSITRDSESDPILSKADEQGFLVIPGDKSKTDGSESQFYKRNVPGFTIHEKIGRGGSSIVYRASRDDEPGTQYAIKVFLESVHNRESLVRFNRETQSLIKLQHPSIAKLHDYGIGEDSHPFLVMELLTGQRIDAYCQKQKLDIDEQVQLFLEVCQTVEFAHQHGILHRDLKPSNILIDSSGKPHLTDFGLAKFLEIDEPTIDKTRTGAVLGTLKYLAPEQIFNFNTESSVTTDVFGLGAVLYSILTGQAPLKFDSLVDAAREYFNRLPSEIDAKYNVPNDLEAICIKCLSPSQSHRYQSVGELILELERFLGGNSVSARTQKYMRKFSLLRRQYPWLVRGACTTLALAITIAIVFYALWRSSVNSLEREEQKTSALKNVATNLGQLASSIHVDSDAPEIIDERCNHLRSIGELYELLLKNFADDPELLFAAGENYFKLARMQHHLGQRNVQYQNYEKAGQLFERLLTIDPNHEQARFGLFHVQISLDNDLRALRLIQALYRDFPENPDYRDAFCSMNLTCAHRHIANSNFEESTPYLEAGLKVLADTPSDERKQRWYHLKSVQADHLCARVAIYEDDLLRASDHVAKSLNHCRAIDPLESGLVGEACLYLRSLDFAFSIEAFKGDYKSAKSLADTADEFYELAMTRYFKFVEAYWVRCVSLRNRATFYRMLDRHAEFDEEMQKWLETLNQWTRNVKQQDLDYHIAKMEYHTFAFRQSFDIPAAVSSIKQLDTFFADKQTYLRFRGSAHLRVGNLETAKTMFQNEKSDGNVLSAAKHLLLVNRIERNSNFDDIFIPAISREFKLRLFGETQSFYYSQLDQQLKHDLRHYKQNRN